MVLLRNNKKYNEPIKELAICQYAVQINNVYYHNRCCVGMVSARIPVYTTGCCPRAPPPTIRHRHNIT